MAYPSRGDYAAAVGGFPHVSILDATLRSGTPARDPNNLLLVYSGGFSSVFPLVVGSNTFALRCWVQDIGDAETRYQAISNYLQKRSLPYFVEFAYVPEGILVNGTKWPITRMEWAEGETLCQFIENNLHDAGLLRTTAAEFLEMAEALHANQISHGDFQDGNILLKRNGTDVEIKLIDYDSLFVPALRGYPDYIVGLPQYQHPSRIAGGGIANEKVDYFSELVIYLSLLSLAEKPGLWSQFGQRTERALLFVEADFKNATQSDVLQELENLSSDVKLLASKLKDFCAKTSIDQLEPLEVLLPRTDPAAKKACNQGLIFLHSQRYNEAIAEFDKAIRIESNFREAHHGLGLTYLQIGNLDLAKRKAEDTLKIDANYRPALQLLDTVKQILRNFPPKSPSSQQSGSGPTSRPSSLKNPTNRDFFGAVITFFQRRQHYFNRRTSISAGALCLFAIILLIWSRWPPDPDGTSVEIIDPKVTQQHANQDDGGVPPQTTRNGGKPVGTIATRRPTAVVSVNAVPWAEVSIKLPKGASYIKPQRIHFTIPPDSSEEKPNVTPIRGGLRVPIGTDVKLEYGDREKIFSYEAWKTSKLISHDFLSP